MVKTCHSCNSIKTQTHLGKYKNLKTQLFEPVACWLSQPLQVLSAKVQKSGNFPVFFTFFFSTPTQKINKAKRKKQQEVTSPTKLPYESQGKAALHVLQKNSLFLYSTSSKFTLCLDPTFIFLLFCPFLEFVILSKPNHVVKWWLWVVVVVVVVELRLYIVKGVQSYWLVFQHQCLLSEVYNRLSQCLLLHLHFFLSP
jgi:hypothetical protein